MAGPRTLVPELAGQPRPDLVLVNDDDLSYAKIRLDDHSLRTLVGPDKGGPGGRGGLGGKVSPQDRGDPGGSPAGAAQSPRVSTGIGEFTDSLPAALCWSAAWDMVRDGEMAARDDVRLVLAASPRWPTSAWCRPCYGRPARRCAASPTRPGARLGWP